MKEGRKKEEEGVLLPLHLEVLVDERDLLRRVRRYQVRSTVGLVLLAFLLGLLSMLSFSFLFGDFWAYDPFSLGPFLNKSIDPETEFPYRAPVAWDISQNHNRKLAYTVDEISWANVDLSPDGSTILFDVLGDLYTLPVTGGKASLLLGGVAYDRQARYSPDGTKVVYTSDASGCDNLWVLDLVTRATFQVTNEPYRFVSNAYWAPNGTTIVGVKWYTSSRSLGAGEIWSFTYAPELGSDVGQRLVGRPSFENQIGPEEPVFSRDGKVIYYSKNTADSSVFEYSKDPHKGIYTIFAFDIITGATTYVTGGTGGAARPILSNDGKTLAFVRRTLFNNSLVIRDLETGNEKVVYSGLSADQQASSAPSGVYPGFSWVKGDQEFIVWAFGKIRRVNLQTGKSAEIPLSVDISLDLAQTVRPVYDPSSGSSFKTKVAQGASRSRSHVLFTSLGRSYVVPLTGGNPQLATQNRNTNDEFEFGVSFSPNGLQAVHVVWSDTKYARVELFTLDGSVAPITLTTEVGRYVYPSFSVNGGSVVFSRIGADTLSGPLYNQKSGIYVVNLVVDKETGLATSTAGAPTLITSGYQATFASDSLSLLVQRDSQAVQVFLDRTTPDRVLATGKYTTSISVSSDLALVAFIEFYELYVAPLKAGSSEGPLELSTKPGYSTPGLRRISPNGGEFFIWPPEGGIKALSFLLGPVLYTVVPDDILSCEANDANNFGVDCVASKTTSLDLSLTVQTNIPQTYTVLDNAVLVTMEGGESSGIIQNGRIVIFADKIQALGPRDQVPIPTGAQVIDVQGGVVMPGYIDVHAHWSSAFGYYVHQSWEFIVNLAFGVTSMHNPSYDTVYGFSDAELVRSGLKVGPRIFSTGTIVYGAAGPYRCEIEDLDAARAALRRLNAYGAFSVKSYNQPCRSSRQMVLEAAKELNMAVVPEGGMSYYWNLNQIIDGHTTIEHSLPVAPVYNDVIELFAKSGTAYTPTLVVSYGGIWGENYWYQNTNVWENSRLTKFSPSNDIVSRSVQRPKAEDEDYNHFAVSRSAKAINDRGGLTQAGAHGQRQGIAFHWELWMFSQGGMSNYNVLKTGTLNGALALGFPNLGKLAPGYLADIIVYPPEASPLADIKNTESVRYVLKDGRLWDASTMDQILPFAQPLPQGPILNIPTN